jgi:alpha-tubulin suppressor-like RCC1 family protein
MGVFRATAGRAARRGAILAACAAATMCAGFAAAGTAAPAHPASSTPGEAQLATHAVPVRRRRSRGGAISLTPSSVRPHWACPEGLCEAIVDPRPLASRARGRTRFALPEGGPLLEGGGEKGGLDPQDLQSAYAIPALGGEDQTVAIVDAYGDLTAEEDLSAYRTRYGLAPCTKSNHCFRKVNEAGEERNYPAPSEFEHGWQTETALDLEMASAACPGCRILLVQAGNPAVAAMARAAATAARLGATEISNSYGLPEQVCTAECATLASSYEHPGVLVTASAGDNGFDNYVEGGQSPNYPAALPGVVAVGGTSLRRDSSPRGWGEEAWSGGGSGCASRWAKPVWQQDTGCASRMEADVSAVGACETPVSVFASSSGGWANVCGTSVSAPLVAGIEAHASGYARSLPGADGFYEDPQALFDVTAGQNGSCSPAAHLYWCRAGAGYDGPTGNGTPDGPLELSSAGAPSAATLPPREVAGGQATLRGQIDPQGSPTTYHFEYGTSAAYGASVPVPDAAAGASRLSEQVSQTLSGLQAGATYHYRLVATNANGTAYGRDIAFATAPPSVGAVSPGFGPAAGGTTVALSGANFESATAVSFGGRPAERFTVQSPTSITALSPPGAGAEDITVTTPAGTSTVSAADEFSYEQVGPILDWGLGNGALGDGTFIGSAVPVEVSALPDPLALSAGYQASLALLPGGTVMGWGENRNGSAGDGTYGAVPEPAAVCAAAAAPSATEQSCPAGPFLQGVTGVASGGFHSLALLADGTVRAWGANGRGQLGVGSTIATSAVPAPVCTKRETPCKPENYLREVAAVAAGERYSLALLRDGTVLAWGENAEGELGTGSAKGPEGCIEGTIACSRVPVPVTHLAGVEALAAGDFHSLALLEDGHVMAWGANTDGQLGDGTTKQRNVPVAVCATGQQAPCTGGLAGVRAVTAGLSTSVALLGNGTVADWGTGENGELGIGTMTGPETCKSDSCATRPVLVAGLSGVEAVASGVEDRSVIAVAGGTVFAWGDGASGELGDGLEEASPQPTPVCEPFATGACPAGPHLHGTVTALAAGGRRGLIALRSSADVVSTLSPARGAGAGGTAVTITGSRLGEASAVHFGSSPAEHFEVVSASEVVAVSPAGSGTVPVTVTTPEGITAPTLPARFSYEDSSVTGVSPSAGPASGGTTVTVTGEKLGGATQVDFGTAPASDVHVLSETELTASSPPGTGVVDVTVTTPEGTSTATPADRFSYQTPQITGLAPAAGPGAGGTTITITGQRLAGATAVGFGTAPASDVHVLSETELTASSPPGTGVVDVTVTTPEGTSPAGFDDRFSYETAPSVQTGGASGVRLTSATLNGTVDPQGGAVTACTFEYGASDAYGAIAECASLPGQGRAPVAVSAALSGLQPGSLYHFRVTATNAAGTSRGEDATFTTPATELPELGRCVKVGTPPGAYGKGCTAAQANGAYGWNPGPGAAPRFTASGGAVTIEALNAQGVVQHVLACSAVSGGGEYTGTQRASMTLTLSHCTSPLIGGPPCRTPGAADGEIDVALSAELGLIAGGAKPAAGLALHGAPGSGLISFECAGTPFTIAGSAIAPLSQVDKMSSSQTLKLHSSKALQSPERFEEGLRQAPLSEGFPAGIRATVKLKGEEPVEVRAKG